MERRLWLIALIVLCMLVFAGCAGEESSGNDGEAPAAEAATAPAATADEITPRGDEKLELVIDGRNVTLEQRWAGLLLTKLGNLDAASAVVFVTSYDPGDPNLWGMTGATSGLEEEGQWRVMLNFFGPEGSSPTDFQPGEFGPMDEAEIGGKSPPFARIRYTGIAYFEEGKAHEVRFNPNTLEGSIKITNVTDDAIAGEVDVADDKNSIRGTFVTVKTERGS